MATTKETTPTKKRGRGRPPKSMPKAHDGWGGKRAGAGRKVKGENGPLVGHVTFRTTEDTLRRVQSLRELTNQDELPFNRMFEKWVEEYAQSYGIE